MDAWSATPDGGQMELRDVARQPGAGTVYLTFYFNGVNHFDSLSGGPGRG